MGPLLWNQFKLSSEIKLFVPEDKYIIFHFAIVRLPLNILGYDTICTLHVFMLNCYFIVILAY